MEKIYLEKQPFIENVADEKVIAVGYFDGLHLGHQKVIKTAVEIAKERGLASAVMTFHPHPSVVLKPSEKRDNYLTPPEKKSELIEKLGVDQLYLVRFDLPFSRLSPQNFIDDYLIKLHAKHVVAGFDFTFGRMAKGNMENIDDYSRSMFSYSIIPKVEIHGQKVSSTYIRSLIAKGKVENVPDYLGRVYEITGTVVHGDKRGRTLGFPTANIECEEPFVLPALGVYIVKMRVDGKWRSGVCSVGVRPTFYDKDGKVTVEVHLLGFDGDLYDKQVTVAWCKRIRGEEKFANVGDLIKRMEKDKAEAADFFRLNGGVAVD